MFSKYLASSFGSHLAAGAAATLSPPFLRIVLLKLSLQSIYTAAGDDRPTRDPEAENTRPMSDFLLNECGLCQADLSTILRRRPSGVGTRSTHTAQRVVQLLRDSGFTEDQVRKIITRNPSMLFAEQNLKPNIELLKTLGFTTQDFGKAIYNGLTEDKVTKMITRSPRILSQNTDRKLKPKLEFIKTLGLTAQDFRTVISREPDLLYCSLEKTLRPNVQYLQNLFGSEAISKVLKWAPWILGRSNGPDYLEKKMKHLASFGFLEDEIKELFRRSPRVLAVSIEKVQKIMDFFIHSVGLPAKFILINPEILKYSLECTIKPRHKVFKAISAMQPSKCLPSLTCVLYLTEGKFLEKYVKCSPHAAKLLEIYSDKPVDPDVIQWQHPHLKIQGF